MIEYIKFWGAKALFEISIFVGVVILIILVVAISNGYIAIKQHFCKHTRAYRNNTFVGFRRYSHKCPDCGYEFDITEAKP